MCSFVDNCNPAIINNQRNDLFVRANIFNFYDLQMMQIAAIVLWLIHFAVDRVRNPIKKHNYLK